MYLILIGFGFIVGIAYSIISLYIYFYSKTTLSVSNNSLQN